MKWGMEVRSTKRTDEEEEQQKKDTSTIRLYLFIYIVVMSAILILKELKEYIFV